MDANEFTVLKNKVQTGVSLFVEAKQLRDTIVPKLTALSQESHSIEGQIQQLLEQGGVSSVAELEEKLRQQTESFLKYATEINVLMKQVGGVLEEVEKKRAEAGG